MSEYRSANKRQRTNAVGVAAVPGTMDYLLMIGSLPIQMVCTILADAAQHHPDVARSVVNSHSNITAAQQNIAEQADPIDFDHCLQSVRAILVDSYQVEASSSVAFEVKYCIKAIGKATRPHSSFRTKKKALKTLQTIGKRISCCRGSLAGEVRNEFHFDSCLETTMLRIANLMTRKERDVLVTEGFLDKLFETDNLDVFDLDEVRWKLLGRKFADGETEEDEEDAEQDSESNDEDREEDAEEGSESNDEDSEEDSQENSLSYYEDSEEDSQENSVSYYEESEEDAEKDRGSNDVHIK